MERNYEYRELSKSKIEELNSMRYTNMYGSKMRFDGGTRCVTTKKEDIVFEQIGYSHESDIANEYFLECYGSVYYVYMYEEYQDLQSNGVGKDYLTLNKVERIVKLEEVEEKSVVLSEASLLKVLKEAATIWNKHNGGRIEPEDNIITRMQYRGEVI